MRIPCPNCGDRDLREFVYQGAALPRPTPDAGEQAWDSYMHLRENPAGPTRDLWYHEAGCCAWLVVSRNTVTHAITSAELAAEAKP
jgi:methylglutamate dehydrogenase subunit B